jgi:hypothetical protein
MFRIAGRGDYYLALISSKGYFRFDVVKDNIPRSLIGWTETPGLDIHGVNLGIIAKSDHFIFMLNGRWIAEAYDAAIPGGHLGFTVVSYEADAEKGNINEPLFPHSIQPAAVGRNICRS